MKGLHCSTCRCGDATAPLSIDPSAPFYGLVVVVDAAVWAERTAAMRAKRAERAAVEVDA